MANHCDEYPDYEQAKTAYAAVSGTAVNIVVVGLGKYLVLWHD